MKKSEIVKLITTVQVLWPHWKAPEDPDTFKIAVEAWHSVLADVPESVGFAAVEQLAASGRDFAPPVGVIRKTAIQLSIRARGDELPGVDQAWLEVQDQIRAFGYTGQPHWSNDAVAQAVASIGWRELCLSTNAEATRAHFFQVYRAISDRVERDIHTPQRVVDSVRLAEGVRDQPSLPVVGRRID